MDGFGEYTDHLGRKWAGEYRDGVFDSRRQRDLVKSIELEERSEHVKEAVLSVAARLVKLIEDSNQEIYRISPFFLRSEETDKLVRCKPLKYDDLTSDRWAQILQSLKK
jgi:pantothenate kinase type III